MNERVLVIAAHPDDEVLGCGGTIARHADNGDLVSILIVAEGATSRLSVRSRERVSRELDDLGLASKNASEILGAVSLERLELPDNRLDTLDRLDLIKAIEEKIDLLKPNVVYVHHAGDVNIDHRRVHEAVVTACRPTPGQTVHSIYSFEVASSTEWQAPGSSWPFLPNWYVDISEQMERKMQALESYRKEMRDWPHPRSIRAVEYQSRLRGSQVGMEAAEAFMLLRKLSR